jgi:hypothetical protein
MREEIDEFITFMMSHKDDERVTIQKDIKYGHKNYWISFDIDSEPKSQTNLRWATISGRLSIHFDKRNECIFFSSENTDISTIAIEDKELLNKWCDIIEEYISSNLKTNFREMIEKSLSSCFNKKIHRDWKMRKILNEDESV